MTSLKRLALACAVALVALVAATASASALTVRVSPAGAITATSSGRVTFAGSSIIRPECNLTIRGTIFAGPIEKVAGNSIGQVTAVQITNCSGLDSVTVLGLPWLIVYLASEGTLPNAVTAVRLGIQTAQFEMRGLPLAGDCLYGGLALVRLLVSGSNPYTTGALPSLGSAAPLSKRGGGFLCPGSGWLDGNFTLSPTQTITLI
jgi:hypothetical protein